MQSVNTLVIGNGIAAKCIIYYLNKTGLTDIVQVFDDKRAPACSRFSTAINCLRGTQRGLSPLGDMIRESYDEFEDFYSKHKPDGVVKSLEYQTWDPEGEKLHKWKRRYSVSSLQTGCEALSYKFKRELGFVQNPAYIFTPNIFFKWIDQESINTIKRDFVESIDLESGYKIVKTTGGSTFKVKNLVLATSYMSPKFSHLVSDKTLYRQLIHSKPVPGSYLKFKISDFNGEQFKLAQSFVFAFENLYIIYRKEDSSVLLGATSKNNVLDFSHDATNLKNLYEIFDSEFKGVIDLPEFEKGIAYTGIRHKGQNRQPFWGQINDGTYAIWGLYKNAFTFSFSAAKEISLEIGARNA